MSDARIWFRQCEIAKQLGVVSITVGKWLFDLGLRDKTTKAATQAAIDEGYALLMDRPKPEYWEVWWNRDKVFARAEELEIHRPSPKTGRKPTPNPTPSPELQIMPFGHHKGKPIAEMPEGYVRWMISAIGEKDVKDWRIWEAVSKRWADFKQPMPIYAPPETPEHAPPGIESPDFTRLKNGLRNFAAHVAKDFHYPTALKAINAPDGTSYVGIFVKHPGGTTLIYLVDMVGENRGCCYPASQKDGKISFDNEASQNVFDEQYANPPIETHTFEAA